MRLIVLAALVGPLLCASVGCDKGKTPPTASHTATVPGQEAVKSLPDPPKNPTKPQ